MDHHLRLQAILMPVEPTTSDLIRSAIESRMLDLHTSIPARVVVYNPVLQTADVQPVVKRAIGTYDGDVDHEDLPIIHNVPVEWPGGGGFAMQFPVMVGDFVWLIFSEAATAQWRSTGQVSEPGDLRRHDLSYACAIFVRGTDANALIPLTPPTEGRMDCPAPFVFSSSAGQAAAQFVANAALVATALGILKTLFDGWVVTPGDGGGALKTAWTAVHDTFLPNVACTKLKAE